MYIIYSQLMVKIIDLYNNNKYSYNNHYLNDE